MAPNAKKGSSKKCCQRSKNVKHGEIHRNGHQNRAYRKQESTYQKRNSPAVNIGDRRENAW